MMSRTSTGLCEAATCSRIANDRAVTPSLCSRNVAALAGAAGLSARGGLVVGLMSRSRLLRMASPEHKSSGGDAPFGAPLLDEREQKHDDGEDHDRAGDRPRKEHGPVVA